MPGSPWGSKNPEPLDPLSSPGGRAFEQETVRLPHCPGRAALPLALAGLTQAAMPGKAAAREEQGREGERRYRQGKESSPGAGGGPPLPGSSWDLHILTPIQEG